MLIWLIFSNRVLRDVICCWFWESVCWLWLMVFKDDWILFCRLDILFCVFIIELILNFVNIKEFFSVNGVSIMLKIVLNIFFLCCDWVFVMVVLNVVICCFIRLIWVLVVIIFVWIEIFFCWICVIVCCNVLWVFFIWWV